MGVGTLTPSIYYGGQGGGGGGVLSLVLPPTTSWQSQSSSAAAAFLYNTGCISSSKGGGVMWPATASVLVFAKKVTGLLEKIRHLHRCCCCHAVSRNIPNHDECTHSLIRGACGGGIAGTLSSLQTPSTFAHKKIPWRKVSCA